METLKRDLSVVSITGIVWEKFLTPEPVLSLQCKRNGNSSSEGRWGHRASDLYLKVELPPSPTVLDVMMLGSAHWHEGSADGRSQVSILCLLQEAKQTMERDWLSVQTWKIDFEVETYAAQISSRERKTVQAKIWIIRERKCILQLVLSSDIEVYWKRVVGVHMLLIPILRRQHQVDVWEFEPSLLYIVNFRLSWAVESDPVSKNEKERKNVNSEADYCESAQQ